MPPMVHCRRIQLAGTPSTLDRVTQIHSQSLRNFSELDDVFPQCFSGEEEEGTQGRKEVPRKSDRYDMEVRASLDQGAVEASVPPR